jgi:hypothetical protein
MELDHGQLIIHLQVQNAYSCNSTLSTRFDGVIFKNRGNVLLSETTLQFELLAKLHYLSQEDASNGCKCLLRPRKEPVNTCVVDETRETAAVVSEAVS